ncbi:tripartite tricarboxylate transporter TctB family protein [Verminephrobacter aporrectodeae]|uniref:Tripartite tricarboxylate transporter TctB family protein n=1 Tax=Verminephrobacter aporrectodeae subsp. tuberculatae TaxID=1110392 RepID=A0ABT3KSC5_9BURK|nr:tripartite tricarboxylate transporter TctB family protein [Verminephrobacter aporrectodeae]MCW5219832.1 tripartite tricarboxylate transporter TctB family protein [Verminephrobacter aporrectodeae subsp. tuberculatae]MCW5256170.1 tripartite tricarboxylate transporter TctB family protein [Verminephrobacter aporrectodeae subsp. tuberculatae]MCW5289120.1 tripartite tricarboxylate transporter TctB family protein [Verminephrobacter aporrectodeae subsp. tuberculatae]MCW5321227.1 tripartite tricarbox
MTQRHSSHSRPLQTLVGAGLVALALFLAWGASSVSAEAGYGGVGPNFLPWVVSVALLVCGALCVVQALTGGFRDLEESSGEARAHWPGFVWVSAGLLLNALLITRIGFILSCALCFVLSVRGFKSSEGRLDLRLRAWVVDFLIGVALAAPVFWMFAQLLAINLPGLTSTGWL